MARIFISKLAEILAKMISYEIKKDIICEFVQSASLVKRNQNSGKHVVIARIAKKSIGEIELQKTKKPMQRLEKLYGLKSMVEIVSCAKENLLEQRENIAAQNVFLKTISKKTKMDVGNGKDSKTEADMDTSPTLKQIKDRWLIDMPMNSTLGFLLKAFMFATNVIIQNAVHPLICFWEQIKITCKIVSKKEGLLQAIKLLEKAKKTVTPFSPMKMFWKLENYAQKVLRIEKSQKDLKLLYFKLMRLDTGELGSISKGVTLGRL